jgi:hypothetical protein
MSKMRVIANVGVVFDVDSYEEAGEILDGIDRKVGKVLGERGGHEITGFQTRPCKAAKFDEMANAQQRHGITPHMTMAGPEPEQDWAESRR